MDLTPYVAQLRDDLATAASAGDEQTRRTAALLGSAIEPAARLALMNALSDLAAEVTASLGDRTVELRLGSENAWKLWLNGKYVFGQNEYHRNKSMDQFIIPVPLQKGTNLILVKVCQNEQTEDWAGDWDFQLRVCDASGTPVRSAVAAVEKGQR